MDDPSSRSFLSSATVVCDLSSPFTVLWVTSLAVGTLDGDNRVLGATVVVVVVFLMGRPSGETSSERLTVTLLSVVLSSYGSVTDGSSSTMSATISVLTSCSLVSLSISTPSTTGVSVTDFMCSVVVTVLLTLVPSSFVSCFSSTLIRGCTGPSATLFPTAFDISG